MKTFNKFEVVIQVLSYSPLVVKDSDHSYPALIRVKHRKLKINKRIFN